VPKTTEKNVASVAISAESPNAFQALPETL